MKFEFIACDKTKISVLLSENIIGLSKPSIKALFSSGEIKLNGIKQIKDTEIDKGDIVYAFVAKKYLDDVDNPKIIYNDQNILIVDKPIKMDVENNLRAVINKGFKSAAPVHRLDRNTRGLVVFAQNPKAYDILFEAFKDKKIEKYYYALVNGRFNQDGEHTAFLKKDAQNSFVKISKIQQAGYKKITSYFKYIKSIGQNSLIEAQLITGRTHQLRAHLAFLGHYILGDNKYGKPDPEYKFQQLVAYKIKFNGLKDCLSYLNNKQFLSEFII